MTYCDKATTVSTLLSIIVFGAICITDNFFFHILTSHLVFCTVFFFFLQVSHTYSMEVAGHGAIAPHRGKFYGILNGIDPDIWDPYTDNSIPVLIF